MTNTDRLAEIAAAAREYRAAEIAVGRLGYRSAGNAEDYDKATRRLDGARKALDAALATKADR